MLTIYFGMALDSGKTYPLPLRNSNATFGVAHCGPESMLRQLELRLGLAGEPVVEVARLQSYQAAITDSLPDHPFFEKSFKANESATAQRLLAMRDELVMNGFDIASFATDSIATDTVALETMPKRLRALVHIEARIRQKAQNVPPSIFPAGFADRFRAVLVTLKGLPERVQLPFRKIVVMESRNLLPQCWQRMFQALESKNIPIEELPSKAQARQGSDLRTFQDALMSTEMSTDGQTIKKTPTAAKGDGSLVVLRASSDITAAGFLARLVKSNTTNDALSSFRPLCILSASDWAVQEAFAQAGLTAFGLTHSSLNRPALQLIKLIQIFLWNPLDVERLLEFLTMPQKPLHGTLAYRLARALAKMPGVGGKDWQEAIESFRQAMSKDAATALKAEIIFEQYDHLFSRERYDPNKGAPEKEIVALYRWLADWARRSGGVSGNSIVRALALQAGHIADAYRGDSDKPVPQTTLQNLIRETLEPYSSEPYPEQQNRLPFITEPGACLETVDEVLWTSFVGGAPRELSVWYQSEREYLQEQGVVLDDAKRVTMLAREQSIAPILCARERVIVVVPEKVHGAVSVVHPLQTELEALFKDSLVALTTNCSLQTLAETPAPSLMRSPTDGATFRRLTLPSYEDLSPIVIPQPQPYWKVNEVLEPRLTESHSSLINLFQYPHLWVLQHKAKLYKHSLVKLDFDSRLQGSLADAFFERVVSEGKLTVSSSELATWIDTWLPDTIAKEATLMLQPRFAVERQKFMTTTKKAMLALVEGMEQGGWEMGAVQTQVPINNRIHIGSPPYQTPLVGAADILLRRVAANGTETAVVDVKWSKALYKLQEMEADEDYQLALYALALGNAQPTHTAYYSISDACFVVRNTEANFGGRPKTVQPSVALASQHAVYTTMKSRMDASYQWRFSEELMQGTIEVGLDGSISELDYGKLPETGYVGLPEDKKRKNIKERPRFDDDYIALTGWKEDEL